MKDGITSVGNIGMEGPEKQIFTTKSELTETTVYVGYTKEEIDSLMQKEGYKPIYPKINGFVNSGKDPFDTGIKPDNSATIIYKNEIA